MGVCPKSQEEAVPWSFSREDHTAESGIIGLLDRNLHQQKVSALPLFSRLGTDPFHGQSQVKWEREHCGDLRSFYSLKLQENPKEGFSAQQILQICLCRKQAA